MRHRRAFRKARSARAHSTRQTLAKVGVAGRDKDTAVRGKPDHGADTGRSSAVIQAASGKKALPQDMSDTSLFGGIGAGVWVNPNFAVDFEYGINNGDFKSSSPRDGHQWESVQSITLSDRAAPH